MMRLCLYHQTLLARNRQVCPGSSVPLLPPDVPLNGTPTVNAIYANASNRTSEQLFRRAGRSAGAVAAAPGTGSPGTVWFLEPRGQRDERVTCAIASVRSPPPRPRGAAPMFSEQLLARGSGCLRNGRHLSSPFLLLSCAISSLLPQGLPR